LQIEETGYWFGADATHNDADRARALAGAPFDAPASLITRFGDDYGFINKRLPVWRVETPRGSVFADVREGLIAARARATWLTSFESWTFDTLHKWAFLNPLGRRNRDYATMIVTAIIIVTSTLGLALAWRRRSPRRMNP
jgi:hypothetical protein